MVGKPVGELTTPGGRTLTVMSRRAKVGTPTARHAAVRSKETNMSSAPIPLTTTHQIDGRAISAYLGIVNGEAILGANVFKDLFAGIRDIVGGRSGVYEAELRRARELAFEELTAAATALGADAVVGIDIDYETIGAGGSMLMVTATGTAVRLG